MAYSRLVFNQSCSASISHGMEGYQHRTRYSAQLSLRASDFSREADVSVSAESALGRGCELGTDAGFAHLHLSLAQKLLANDAK